MIVATRLNIGDFVDFSRSGPMVQAFDDEKKHSYIPSTVYNERLDIDESRSEVEPGFIQDLNGKPSSSARF